MTSSEDGDGAGVFSTNKLPVKSSDKNASSKVDASPGDSGERATSLSKACFERFQDGDFDAMDQVVALYSKPLIGYIRLITRKQEIAEEIAQEVFLLTYQHRARIHDEKKIRAWLYTLARREAIREIKRKSHQAEISFDDSTLVELAGSVEERQTQGLVAGSLQTILKECVDSLRKRDRELIILRYFCDLQIKEIAEILHVPVGSVGVYLQRALEKLRKQCRIRGICFEDFV